MPVTVVPSTVPPLRPQCHITRHLLTFDGGRTYCMATKVTGADGVSRLVERSMALTGIEVEAARRTGALIVVPL